MRWAGPHAQSHSDERRWFSEYAGRAVEISQPSGQRGHREPWWQSLTELETGQRLLINVGQAEPVYLRVANIGKPVVDMMLTQLDEEQPEEQIQRLLPAAATDPKAAKTAGRRLLDLRIAIDALEDELAWPNLVREAESRLADVRNLVEAPAAPNCCASASPTPAWHALVFQDLVRHRDERRSTSHTDRLIAQGTRALVTGEQERLPTINMQLAAPLPEPPPPPNPFSTIYLAR
jgi:hypothetical protein